MAISTAQEIVQLKLPSLDLSVGGSDEERVDDLVELAKFHLSENFFNEKYQYALALLVCHQISLDSQGGGDTNTSGSGSVGGIKSKKEGDLQVTYGGMSSNTAQRDQYLASTIFGQELLDLIKHYAILARTRLI